VGESLAQLGNDIQDKSYKKWALNNYVRPSMKTFPKKFREQAGTPLFPRDNKLAEWPQAGNGTEA
jgi:hypothetical protein